LLKCSISLGHPVPFVFSAPPIKFENQIDLKVIVKKKVTNYVCKNLHELIFIFHLFVSQKVFSWFSWPFLLFALAPMKLLMNLFPLDLSKNTWIFIQLHFSMLSCSYLTFSIFIFSRKVGNFILSSVNTLNVTFDVKYLSISFVAWAFLSKYSLH